MLRVFSQNWCIKILVVCLLSISFLLGLEPAEASPQDKTLEEQVIQILLDHPEAIVESVERYQKSQKEEAHQAQVERLEAIRKDPELFIGSSPIQGDIDSQVILIEFSDFQCPYCRKAHKTLKNFVANHSDQIALVYKHFPLKDVHAEAIPAATAAWAAHQQHKFWDYQDFLFTHQDELGEDLYIEAAKELGLDLTQFEQDRMRQDAMSTIQNDVAFAKQLGISGTPFFVMNTETFFGAVKESFFEDMLKKLTT